MRNVRRLLASALVTFTAGCDASSVADPVITPSPSVATVPQLLAGCVSPGVDMFGCWLFDEGQGLTSADGSGSGMGATLSGAPAWVTGVHGSALEFTAETQLVNVGALLSGGTRALSVVAWVRATSFSNTGDVPAGISGPRIISATDGGGWAVGHAPGSGRIQVELRGISSFVSSASFPLDQWAHLVVTYDGASVNVYLDNVLVDHRSAPADLVLPYASCTFIGNEPEGCSRQTNGNFAWQGALDEVAVYRRALTAAEVDTLYQRTPTGGPPLAFLASPSAAVEGESVAFDAGASTDPEGDIVSFTWNFGDGSPPLTTSGAVVSHVYADNGTYAVSVIVEDSHQATASAGAALLVTNASPVLGTVSVSVDPIPIGTLTSVNAMFSDPGRLDTHSATANWGDQQNSSMIVAESNGSGALSTAHQYSTAGVYTVTVTVVDKDGASASATVSSYVVVYDPNGGFVTGGGWIDSPAGAYAANPSLTGKANFGLVARYEHGASQPSGNTQFTFKQATFVFASTAYDWLVVAGTRAQYKGYGTVNGQGHYRFMLTAIDGGSTGGDRLRLRVWDDSNARIIYDNQMDATDDANPTTALGGGRIQIHR